MELNTLVSVLLAVLSQCSVKDATLAVIKFQALYLMVKENKVGEMSILDILAKGLDTVKNIGSVSEWGFLNGTFYLGVYTQEG